MLGELEIRHFRGLKMVNVPLRPLTVLIGKNDTGKSSFLAAIEALANNNSLPRDVRFQHNEGLLTSIRAEIEGGGFALSTSKPEGIGYDKIGPATLYRLPVHGVSMQSEGYEDQADPSPLGSDGTGVPSLLDHFLRTDRDRFDEVLAAIKNHIPGIQDIRIGTPSKKDRRLDLILDGGFKIPADQASAGVRLMLFFVALAYHPNQTRLILLEEPENGIHPKRLAEVMRLLKGISRGEHASHSCRLSSALTLLTCWIAWTSVKIKY